MVKAEKKYCDFHGHPVRYERDFDFRLPPGKRLIILGRAVAVEYETDKRNGGGDGRTAVYRHTFETPAYICCDSTGTRQLYILGDELKVTSKGIEK